jgi:hypothetical protein
MRLLFKLQIGLGVLFVLVGLVTLFWHNWIEVLSGWDPDRGDGSLEWAIGAALLLVGGTMSSAVWLRCKTRRFVARP